MFARQEWLDLRYSVENPAKAKLAVPRHPEIQKTSCGRKILEIPIAGVIGAKDVSYFLSKAFPDLKLLLIEGEPRRVCQRLISVSYAAMGSVSRAA
jgi:hypothetical protein